MARRCFCGCGRSIGWASRKLNRDGERLHELLVGMHAFVLPALKPEPGLTDNERQAVEESRAHTEAFADEGTLLRGDLVSVLHDEASVLEIDRPRVGAWMRAALDMNEGALRHLVG